MRDAANEAQTVRQARTRASRDHGILERRHSDTWFAATYLSALVLWLVVARPASVPVVAFFACVAAHAVASSIEFEIGPGSALPTAPVIVVALFLLPAEMVPIVVVVGLLLSATATRLRDPARRDRVSVLIGSAFHAFGPALVFYVAGVTVPSISDWPVYVLAAVALIVFDMASAWFLNCYRLGLPVSSLELPLGFAYLVDIMLTPIGYMAVFAAPGSIAGLLLLLPILALLAMLQRDRRKQLDRAILLATQDPLTGLPNRTVFHQRLEERLIATRSVAVLLIDLDRFKEVNDSLGHACGDDVLNEVGRRLQPLLGASEVVARLGGDEFALLLHAPDEAIALLRARDLLTHLRRPFAVGGFDVDIDASIGLAISADDSINGADLLRRADVAMYAAKEDRSGVALYSTERDHYSPERLAVAGRLRRAIADGELALHYQPKIDLDTGDVVGVEALVRWNCPGRGMVVPDEFIGLAERTDLIHPLTRFVLAEAMEQAAAWRDAGRPLPVSVNLSPRNLSEDDLVEWISGLLQLHRLSPDALEIEITETAVMANPTRAAEVMTQLRSAGITISIDDFGTGHSSLSYLTTLPADVLKIDQSFIRSISDDESAATVVRAIVDLARSLHLRVVAEGVEDRAALDMLRQMDCAIAQGYFFTRPLPAEELDGWLIDYGDSRRAADTEQRTEREGARVGLPA